MLKTQLSAACEKSGGLGQCCKQWGYAGEDHSRIEIESDKIKEVPQEYHGKSIF